MMRNAGTKSKGIQIFGVLSFFLIWGFEDFVHSKTETEFIKYSDLKKPIKGDGSLGNPYQIAHPFHLKEMRDNLGSHFKLTRSLDLEENKNFKPIGGEKNPFEGTFDGGGKTIRNLQIKRSDEDYVGLFGRTGKSSTIQNVRLEKIEIVGEGWVGGLVGWNDNGTIKTSYATGKVEGKSWNIGGLVGRNVGTIQTSYATGKVEGEGNTVGGLVGYNSEKGTIKTSYATGKVEGKGSVGGLVGYNSEKGTIKTSYATGKVEGKERVGGLVGWNYGTIKTSYATGKVNGKFWVGGLVGGNDGTIEKSYATGKVEGEGNVGGLVGDNLLGTIQTSYATGKVEGEGQVGGLVGYNYEGTIEKSYAAGKVEGEREVGGLVGWNHGTIQTSYAAGKVNGKKDVGGFVGENYKDGRIEGKNYWQKGSAKEGIGKNKGKVSHLKAKSKFKIISKELEWDLEVWEFPPGKHPRLRWQSSSR